MYRELTIFKMFSPLTIGVTILAICIFSAFRWMGAREESKASAAIEGVLRSEYVTANSYALSKALTDLESLGIIRCAELIEKLEFERTFYDTAHRASCASAGALGQFLDGFFVHEANLQAVNGLTYRLRFRIPLRWQAAMLEAMSYFMIALLALLYRRVVKTQALKQAMTDALVNQSKQVSHDIRSPLSALNMVVASMKELPEEKRLIIRNSVQRINDIANGLLQQAKGPFEKNAPQNKSKATATVSSNEPIMLVALLDALVSEKRIQFRERMEIEIQGDLNQGYGLFARVNAAEFARVISNLVNNSVEAMPSGGRVTIAIRGYKDQVAVIVSDNGKGIPPEVLARMGERGVTHGKEGTQSGSGLGVFHARETVEKAGGKFAIQSQVGLGTMITLTLPRVATPAWFVEKINVTAGAIIVSVDDDQTIHQIWSGRLSSAGAVVASVQHMSFSSMEQFEGWTSGHERGAALYLIDYEFLGQTGNGLDLIERTGLAKNAILVTSRYEEPQVRARAEGLGVRILPKALAPFVPLDIEKAREKFAAVLIDDDTTLIHPVWQMAAKEKGARILCFATPEEFWRKASEIDPASPVYIDVSLANGVRGEDVARDVLARGFTDVLLATGHAPDSITPPTGVKRIVGKDPIF